MWINPLITERFSWLQVQQSRIKIKLSACCCLKIIYTNVCSINQCELLLPGREREPTVRHSKWRKSSRWVESHLIWHEVTLHWMDGHCSHITAFIMSWDVSQFYESRRKKSVSEVDASQSVCLGSRYAHCRMLKVLRRCQRMTNTFQSHELVNDGNSVWELETVPETFWTPWQRESVVHSHTSPFPIRVFTIQTPDRRWFRTEVSQSNTICFRSFSLQEALQC